MATTEENRTTADADLAGQLREASFASILARADGEALAAAGLLATGCVATGTPYQVSAVRTREAVETRRAAADEAATVVPVGIPDTDGPITRPSLEAFEAAADLGGEPDPALALAGVVAGGRTPEAAAPGLEERAGYERRPGIAAPTADLADGLAHTTLVHGPVSGDPEAAEALVADLDDADRERRAASLLAIDAVSAEGTTVRAADAVERAIHPLAGGPVETVEGLADVLGALAATAPGRATAMALGDDPEPALEAWRDHAVAVHEAVRGAETARHDGLLVAHVEGPVEAAARLLRDFRSPEPAVLAIGDGEAALATTDATAGRIEPAAEAAGGSGLARADAGYARFDPAAEDALVEAVRGAS